MSSRSIKDSISFFDACACAPEKHSHSHPHSHSFSHPHRTTRNPIRSGHRTYIILCVCLNVHRLHAICFVADFRALSKVLSMCQMRKERSINTVTTTSTTAAAAAIAAHKDGRVPHSNFSSWYTVHINSDVSCARISKSSALESRYVTFSRPSTK